MSCRVLAQDVMERLVQSRHPMGRIYAEQGNFTEGQPDAARLERAASFARAIVTMVS